MNKQSILACLALTLGATYVFFFTDLLKKTEIHISYRNLERGDNSMAFFYFEKPCRLTSIKVVSASEAETNKYPHILWRLTAKKPTEPIADFTYGQPIKGLQSDPPQHQPEPLKPDEKYRMIVESGSRATAQIDFEGPDQ